MVGAAPLRGPSGLKADAWMYFRFWKCEDKELHKSKVVCKICKVEKYSGNIPKTI